MQIISTGRVFKVGDMITYRNKLKEHLGPQGAAYNIVNTSSTLPGAGQLYIPPSGLTLRISEWSSDAVNHRTDIASLPPGTIITIGSATCVLVQDPIYNTDYFSLFVDVLPVVADGNYIVKVTEP